MKKMAIKGLVTLAAVVALANKGLLAPFNPKEDGSIQKS